MAIDPGHVHCGAAVFGKRGEVWYCVLAGEVTPEQLITLLEKDLDMFTTVVVESWQLYAGVAQQQVGSELDTVKLIGVIEYLVRKSHGVILKYQQAAIKTAARAVATKKKGSREFVAKALGHDPDGHGLDAELHGYRYLGGLGVEFECGVAGGVAGLALLEDNWDTLFGGYVPRETGDN